MFDVDNHFLKLKQQFLEEKHNHYLYEYESVTFFEEENNLYFFFESYHKSFINAYYFLKFKRLLFQFNNTEYVVYAIFYLEEEHFQIEIINKNCFFFLPNTLKKLFKNNGKYITFIKSLEKQITKSDNMINYNYFLSCGKKLEFLSNTNETI